MKLNCFILQNHLVVTKEFAGEFQYHYIRGEKSTRIEAWILDDWKKLKKYLFGTLGVSDKLNITLYSFKHDHYISTTFLSIFNGSTSNDFLSLLKDKLFKVSDKDLGLLNFEPMSGRLVVRGVSTQLLSLLQIKKLSKDNDFNQNKNMKNKNTRSSNVNTHTKSAPKKNTVDNDSYEGVWVNSYHSQSEFSDVVSVVKGNETQGLVMRVSGSGFYLYVENVSLYVQKRKVRTALYTLNSRSKKSYTVEFPKNGDVLSVKLNKETNNLLVKVGAV
ncbi:hypothetical protein [Moritella sp. Urea-trap-13]|uniref:hypothetical protein n=1 Tax=Moritella sp. Urea-trap-13 TaxID=2058327 RepID=UPI000C33728D|nr:hypothetical protein [Moritella sp. Urea-trap-13]PKH07132.1 hypothetical protein CXF93_14795 [Moritella sp. Urea-trap-13]